MNAAQVKAKARKAALKREQQIEQEEIEGGEINLIPYLDIVTNLLLFTLITVAASFIVGEINTTLPNYTPTATRPADPQKSPNEERLQLVVSATPKGMILWSMTGLEGSLREPRATIPVVSAPGESPIAYDYRRLNDALYEIAARRWKGRLRTMETYEIILQADAETPYETIIKIMDNMRRRIPPGAEGKPLDPVGLPDYDEATDGGAVTVKEPFDPDKHYLFPDILFSLGFQ
jgi:biopolymer transport protein TolR